MAARAVRTLVVAASLTALAAAPAGVAGADTPVTPATFRAQGPTPTVTAAVRLTKDETAPTRAYSGPSMLADPDNPQVIVAATADLRTRACYLIRSTDAGRSWHRLKALPTTSSLPFC